METVITRDTDIIREYLAALDSRERGLSPFARFAATTKLARLRRELSAVEMESTDEDIAELRREVSERINRSAWRRFVAKAWGGRLFAFCALVIFQQLALAAMWLLTRLFIRFAPVPKRWNPVLPHEQPGFLYTFVFLFFFVTPMLATLVVFGGRYYRAWRLTVPATLLILALSFLWTFLVFRGREASNPVRHPTSLEQFARDRDVTVTGYRQWADAVWIMRDPQFQRDYESYLRDGPGRWITSRLESEDDAAWRPRNDDSDALKVMNAYLDNGLDENGFREWLKYYLDRHRVYSSDRIDQEVSSITGSANQRYLGLWQLEPFLKERDRSLYSGYLGSIESAMKQWGLLWLGLLTLVFLGGYFATSAAKLWSRVSRIAGRSAGSSAPLTAAPAQSSSHNFPERTEITTPPFFDTPFKLLANVHRSFLKLAVTSSVLVFLFWSAVYALELSGNRANPTSQLSLMRSNLFFVGRGEPASATATTRATITSSSYLTVSRAWPSTRSVERTYSAGDVRSGDGQASALERQLEENDYQNARRFKQQYQAIAAQKSEVSALKNQTAQLQQTTTVLPEQISDVSTRATAAEARAGQVGTDAAAARQAADQLSAKLKDVEGRAARAADQVGRVEGQLSMLSTRTETLDKEFEQRARQIEARTEELGERTEGLKDTSERIQRIAFTSILSELTASADDLDRRISASFYRLVNKADARREADALAQRIKSLTSELSELKSEQAAQWVAQLNELAKRVDEIVARIK